MLFGEARPHQQGLGARGSVKNVGTALNEAKGMGRVRRILFCERGHFPAEAEGVSVRQS